MRRLASLLLLATLVGCARPGQEMHWEIREAQRKDRQRVAANLELARQMLVAREIAAGQSVEQVVARVKPHHVTYVDHWAWIEFDEVPNQCGLSLLARDNKLVRATYWTCTFSATYFDQLTTEDYSTAVDLIQARVGE